MLWKKLECKVMLKRPCKATNPSGARERNYDLGFSTEFDCVEFLA